MIALQETMNLQVLNLSSNMIQKLDSSNLEAVKNLHILDLSRNQITSVLPGTFRDLKRLKYLDLSLNSLRTVNFMIQIIHSVVQFVLTSFFLFLNRSKMMH